MMLRKTMVLVAITAILLFGGNAPAATESGNHNPQTTCPVMGGKIDKNVFLDYQGKRIYFCCTGCIDDFKKNPEQYLKKLEEQGVVPEKSPGSQ